MLSKTTYPAEVGRACRHKDTITLSYRSVSEKTTQVLNAGSHLCGSCADLVKELFEASGPSAAIEMPPIVAKSEKQAGYASRMRARTAARLAPILEATRDDPRPTAFAVHQACKLMLSVRRADFWLNNKDAPITASWLQGQVAALYLGRLPSKDPRRENSPILELMESPYKAIAEDAVAAVRLAIAQEKDSPPPPPPAPKDEFDFGF